LAVAALVAHASIYWRATVDDSFISYRFAHNWAQGLGPVYQPGDRVEGYTSFLWVALLALCGRLGLDPETASKAIGLVSAAAVLPVVYLLARRLVGNRPTALVAPWVLAIHPLF